MIKPACDLQTIKTGKKSTLGFRQITSYLPEGFRKKTSYFPEGFRQITSYLPEGFQRIRRTGKVPANNLLLKKRRLVFGHFVLRLRN